MRYKYQARMPAARHRTPTCSWGSLLMDSRSAEHWWIQVFPGLLIFVTVLCYNLLGEGVRDALDPRVQPD